MAQKLKQSGDQDRLLTALNGVDIIEYPHSKNTSVVMPAKGLRYVVDVTGEILEKWTGNDSNVRKPWLLDRRRIRQIMAAHRQDSEKDYHAERDPEKAGGWLSYVGDHSLKQWEQTLDGVVAEVPDIVPAGKKLPKRTVREYLKAVSYDPKGYDPQGNRANIFHYAAQKLGYPSNIQTECLKDVVQQELLKEVDPKAAERDLLALKSHPERSFKMEATYVRAGYTPTDLYHVNRR